MKELLQSQAGRRSSLATLKTIASPGDVGTNCLKQEVDGVLEVEEDVKKINLCYVNFDFLVFVNYRN